MDITRLIFTSLCLFATCSGQCHDVDTAACQTMAKQDAKFCNTSGLSNVACPHFCNKCSLQCYHCDSLVRDPNDCSSRRMCQPGEKCIMYQVTSSMYGHSEYRMTCAAFEMCGNQGIMPFGRRELHPRTITTQCCSNDLCNSPSLLVNMMSTRPTTTTPTSCYRDIEFLIQKSKATDPSYVRQFLKDFVSHIEIGADRNLVGIASYDNDVDKVFKLNSHRNKTGLLNAIDKIDIHGHDSDIDTEEVGDFLKHYLHAGTHGDRQQFKDVAIILTDHSPDRRRFVAPDPHHKVLTSIEIIVINIGTAISHSAFSASTDANHVIDIQDYSALSSTLPRILHLLCE